MAETKVIKSLYESKLTNEGQRQAVENLVKMVIEVATKEATAYRVEKHEWHFWPKETKQKHAMFMPLDKKNDNVLVVRIELTFAQTPYAMKLNGSTILSAYCEQQSEGIFAPLESEQVAAISRELVEKIFNHQRGTGAPHTS
ncbi:MAG: hypothetical protein HUK20_13145 [Fibrobacter sp.]|nr:hypothetical protein [Fibrobacter sp.]